MNGPGPDQMLQRLVRQARQTLWVTALCWLPVVVTAALLPDPLWLRVSLTALVLAFLAIWLENWLGRLDLQTIARHLDREYQQLQDSTELLLRSPRSAVEGLQAARTRRELRALAPGIRARVAWPMLVSAAALIAGLGAILVAIWLVWIPGSAGSADRAEGILQPSLVTVRVTPPAYTGLPGYNTTSMDLQVPEGSRVDWRLLVPPGVAAVAWQSDRGVSIPAQLDDANAAGDVTQQVVISLQAQSSEIYRMTWTHAETTRAGDFHTLVVDRDLPPELTVLSPEQSPALIAADQPPVALFSLEARDDYGLGEASILATVASGAGENVRFRENRFEFDPPRAASEGGQVFSRQWHLIDLGMAPGDELYFQALVSDRREPQPNQARTAVMMLRWAAGESPTALAIDGIAVDLLPEYFRSQRQIIIDTERLLDDQESISAAEGYRRAQGLALDQKSLRLRYGQYLGEEYSSDIGVSAPQAAPLADGHGEESFAEHLAHAGESGGGHGHEAEEHGPVSATIGSLPEFMADFVHTHDSAEQATLFDEKTRETLQAALSAMWAAELALHLRQPAQALPHEYRALDLIKQVQQANRIYVRRAGFEPPPLDEEKRLSGELEEARPPLSRMPTVTDEGPWQAAWAALADDWLSDQQPVIAAAVLRLPEAERAQARLSLARLAASSGRCGECINALRAMLWRHGPTPTAAAASLKSGPERELARRYFQLLEPGQ